MKVSLETLMQRLRQRTAAECLFHWQGPIPSLPEVVELNTYRIFQECVNNVEKYARASVVTIDCFSSAEKLNIMLVDNGKGFTDDSDEPKEGGFGLRSMNQRADLIRCFYPCRLSLESELNKGTTVTLEIELSPSNTRLTF